MRSPPILAVLILALALVPSASAQVPATPAACAIAMEAPASPPPVAPGAGATMHVVVANTGNLPARITVSATIGQGGGWTLGEQPAQEDVASGQSRDFVFTLTPGDGAGEQAIVNFAAQADCYAPGPGSSCAPLAQCSAGENTSGVVTLATEQGFRIPGLDRVSFPLEWLIAGIGFVAVATAIPFLMKRKKRALVAQCPEPLKMVRAGRGTSFPIELRNPGAAPITAAFEVSPVPEGWSAFMPLPEVQLAAHEARSLWLMVRTPATAQVGETVDVELRLRTGGAPAGSVRVRAEVQGGPE